ncbi:MAG: EamA family transporter [Mucinivorans sp.]
MLLKKSAGITGLSTSWWILIMVAAVVYGLSFFIYSYILKEMPINVASPVMALSTMILVVVASSFFFTEPVTSKHLMGFAMGGAAMYLLLT